jgi:hypothetical protein
MSLDAHLRQTCVIVRDTPAGEDAYGGPGPAATTTVYEGNCRYVEKSERIFRTDRSEVTVVTRYMLMLPAAASEVRELDRVESVTMDGVTIAGPFKVSPVIARRGRALHHLSIDLEKL